MSVLMFSCVCVIVKKNYHYLIARLRQVRSIGISISSIATLLNDIMFW